MTLRRCNKALGLFRFVTRLASDVRGNTLAIVAAAIIPLAALVGSGIDMSRAYMAQARLQMACDASALAGRRAMTTGAVDDAVRAEALKFFRFNFPTGENGTTPLFGVDSFTPSVNDGTDHAVVVSASTRIPTTLMSMFGYSGIPISANCNARLDFRNTDIMLVLDTTGSMDWDPDGNDVNGGPTSRIVALRAAVLALYDALAPVQTQLEAVGLRLRYGIVPYSSGVNVGAAIRAVDQNYMVSQWTYQTRVANFNTPNYVGTTGSTGAAYWQVYGGSLSQSNCLKFMKNQNPYRTATDNGADPPDTLITYSFPNDNQATAGGTNGEWGWSGAPDTSGTDRSCRRKVAETPTTYTQSGWKFTNWTYKPLLHDVSNFRSGSAITLATNSSSNMNSRTVATAGSYSMVQLASMGFSTSSYSWSGCIEERDTVTTITSSSAATKPSGAYDLDLDTIPSDDATRWRPQFSQVTYVRNSTGSADPTAEETTSSTRSNASVACPVAAKPLQVWTRADLSSYLNSLTPNGNTYHDFGMIWGGRFISPDGIFASNNPSTFNNMGVDRYIIYMTDGELNTSATNYGLYGIEYIDRRVTGEYTSYNDQNGRHAKRFSIACNEAKAKVNSLWVIAFASDLSTELTNCASTPAQAATVANSAALTEKFVEIGRKIGALRLAQ